MTHSPASQVVAAALSAARGSRSAWLSTRAAGAHVHTALSWQPVQPLGLQLRPCPHFFCGGVFPGLAHLRQLPSFHCLAWWLATVSLNFP